MALCLEHGAAAIVIVLLLELIKLLLALFGAPKVWHYLMWVMFLSGDILIVTFLVVHTCYKIWRSRWTEDRMDASASGWRSFGRLLVLYGAIALLGMYAEVVYRTLAANDVALLASALSFLAGAVVALVIVPAIILPLLRKHTVDFKIGPIAHHIEMRDE